MDGNLLHMEDVDRIKGCVAVFAKGKAPPQWKGQCEGKSLCGFSPCVPLLLHKKDTRLGVFFMELMIRFELTTSSLPRTRSTY